MSHPHIYIYIYIYCIWGPKRSYIWDLGSQEEIERDAQNGDLFRKLDTDLGSHTDVREATGDGDPIAEG